MTEVAIRPYEGADLGACRALWVELVQQHRQLYADPSIGGDAPGGCFDAHLARVGGERVWVAVRGTEVVGMAGLVAAGDEAEVEPLIVAAQARGEGIGRALLDHVTAEAHRLQVRYLSVRPVARNQQAISWFCKAGFGTLGRIELFAELGPTPAGNWRPGPDWFGCPLRI